MNIIVQNIIIIVYIYILSLYFCIFHVLSLCLYIPKYFIIVYVYSMFLTYKFGADVTTRVNFQLNRCPFASTYNCQLRYLGFDIDWFEVSLLIRSKRYRMVVQLSSRRN